MRSPDEIARDAQQLQDRDYLRKFKRPIGARAARGKRYLPLAALPRLGAAIEKRARKALKRARDQERSHG
jgi:hypothetical protein